MSSAAVLQAARLRQMIHYHLDNDILDGAHFLAGRLQALDPRNPDSAHLLALTCLRLRRYQAAHDASAKYGAFGKHLGCAYVFAQACLKLGTPMEGMRALDKAKILWVGKTEWLGISEHSRWTLPDAPAVLLLKAKLWTAHGDLRKAGDCYQEVHALNPFMWEAFEGLCKIGADLKVDKMFRIDVGTEDEPSEDETASTHIYVDEDSRQPLAPHPKVGQQKNISMLGDPFGPGKTGNKTWWLPKLSERESDAQNEFRTSVSEWDTPTANGANNEDINMGGVSLENADLFEEPPAAPSRRPWQGEQFDASDRIRQPTLRGHLQSASEGTQDEALLAPRKPSVGGHKRTISGQMAASAADAASQPRRSNRLFTQGTSSRLTRAAADSTISNIGRGDPATRTAKPATGAKGRTGVVGRVVSGNRKVMPPSEREKEKRALTRHTNKSAQTIPPPKPSVTEKEPPPPPPLPAQTEEHVNNALLSNFRHLALGYNALSRFDLPQAIQIFQEHETRESPWVLAQTAKAYYEANEYKKAEQCFGRLLKIQPTRVEDMDLYSTVLWHLKKEIPLNWLCQLLRETAFDAPQTWVAIGNALSLSREHDQAISAFRRATQLDENFAYAYTLMGHEHLMNEAYDAGLSAFRKTVAIDRRNYGGWYGLGKSYERMGKLEDAEKYYRIASSINPSNSTLYVCIGVVLERLRKREAALGNYTRALDLQPSSALARFKKARVLMHLKDYQGGLIELEILRDLAPDEANVWFLLGKCYKGLGDKGEALRALTTALNLDSKAAPFIKEAMESLDGDDESDDD